jgi:fluoroacetyl-CoA thioesterase
MQTKLAAQGVAELVVGPEDLATAQASGDVEVLSTPRVVAICEQAAMQAVRDRLDEGQTTVGSRVEVAHVAPVRLGTVVRATAVLERVEGRRMTFNVSVSDRCGLVAAGKLCRVIVDREQFAERAR